MLKKSFIVFLFLVFSLTAAAQDAKKKKERSFMDNVQNVLGIRRSYDVSSETVKPGVLSFKKDDDEEAVFNIDIAFIYKGFRYDQWGFSPAIQFDYSSKPKDQLEKLKAGFDVYYKIYQSGDDYAKLEPAVSLSRDYYNDINEFQTSLSYIPRYPDFILPLRNVSDIKFLYDGTDNRWVFGFNPIVGTNFKRIYSTSRDLSESDYFASFAGSFSIKRYYMLFELYGRYEQPFGRDVLSRYKYDLSAIFYFDDKERSSLNLRMEQDDLGNQWSRKLTIGFGIKL